MRYTCLRHQGTGAFYHFAPKPTGVPPGNGLFIIAGFTFLFLFVQAKKKERKLEFLNALKTKLRK